MKRLITIHLNDKIFRIEEDKYEDLNILIVGICFLLLIVSLCFVSRKVAHKADSVCFIYPHQSADLNKEFKVPSQTVNAIKNETEQLTKEAEIIYDSEHDNGTNVKLFKTTQARQDNLSENETPKGRLPP